MTERKTIELSPSAIAACRKILAMKRGRIPQIVEAVSEELGVPAGLIYGRSRKRDVVLARWVVMHEARKAGMTSWQIANALGKDHSAVLHGVKQYERMLAE